MKAIEQYNTIDQDDPMVSRVLEAAEQCIERYGIRRTSMGEVARVAGVSRGSVYRYFDDKDALVAGVFSRRQTEYLNRTESALEKLDSLVDKITESVMAARRDMREGFFARLAETEPETVSMMFLDSGFYQRSVAFWPPHIEQAKARGEISSEVATNVATDFVMRLSVSLVTFTDMGKSLVNRAEVKRYLAQVVTAGLGSKSI